MTCSECIHYIHAGHRSYCDETSRPAGFLNKACGKFYAGDSSIERSDYLKDLAPIKNNPIKKQRILMSDKNLVQPAIPEGHKLCKKCGRVLPLESFPLHHKSKDGHTGTCKECFSAIQKASQKKAQSEKAEAENPEPAKMISETVKKIAEKDTSIRLDYPASILGTVRDAALVAELRRRGWEVKATKTTIVEL